MPDHRPDVLARPLRLTRATFPIAVLSGQAAGSLVATGLYGPQTARFYATTALSCVLATVVHTGGVTIALRRHLRSVQA